MKAVIREIKGNTGTETYQDRIALAPVIRIGRAADCEVFLNDLRVSLQHAELRQSGNDHFTLDVNTLAGVRVNNKPPVRSARLKIGDELMIGRYRLTLEATDEASLRITVRAEAADEDAQTLRNSNTATLSAAGWKKRFWAWALFLLIALGLGVLPFVLRDAQPNPMTQLLPLPTDEVWLSGPISSAHQSFGSDCQQCHEKPFQHVSNGVCTDCHQNIGAHSDDPDIQSLPTFTQRCTACHLEHDGDTHLIPNNPALCTDCHSEPEHFNTEPKLAAASDFEHQHPEFTPLLQQNGTNERVEAEPESTAWRDETNLFFPHDVHLDPAGIESPTGDQVLECVNCHTVDAGQTGYLPVDMETHCIDCHRLDFDPDYPDLQLPHGDVAKVKATIEAHYARLALLGGVESPSAPAVVRSRRRIGEELNKPERLAALAWATATAKETTDQVYQHRLCSKCHEVEFDESKQVWDVEPAKLNQSWFSSARFSHRPHLTEDCSSCHAAAESAESSDLLLPNKETCLDCHSGVEGDKLQSSCTMCHGMHTATHAWAKTAPPETLTDQHAQQNRTADAP